jgi:dihydrofolate synthase / folylpolyglutamate synthase
MFDLPKYGEGLCLARLAAVLDVLAIDRAWLQRVSVAVCGSNGKGSTAAFCAAIGEAYGLRTGLFTSPHLVRFNERFRIDGAPIADDELSRLSAQVVGAIAVVARRRGERFGAFEAQFALACLYFRERCCGLAVFEAGIGGRYDPVRLVGAQVSCVTSVDLEHTALLGDSLELIASDKSDACAGGGLVVYGENCRPLRDHLAEYNRNRDVGELYVRDEVAVRNEVVATTQQRFDLEIGEYRLRGLKIGLLGGFQINNAAIAATMFVSWLQRAHPDHDHAIAEVAIRTGLHGTSWPGRLETVRAEPLTMIDVGHTPDGIRQALTSLFAIHGRERWVLVLGASRDKRADDIVAELAPSFATIICSSARHKGAPAEAIAEAARRANPQAEIVVSPTIADAERQASALAEHRDLRIYVAGGLFLAVEFATILDGGRAEDLDFF